MRHSRHTGAVGFCPGPRKERIENESSVFCCIFSYLRYCGPKDCVYEITFIINRAYRRKLYSSDSISLYIGRKFAVTNKKIPPTSSPHKHASCFFIYFSKYRTSAGIFDFYNFTVAHLFLFRREIGYHKNHAVAETSATRYPTIIASVGRVGNEQGRDSLGYEIN